MARQIISREGSFNPQQVGSQSDALRAEFSRRDRQQNIVDAQEDRNYEGKLRNIKTKGLNEEQVNKDMKQIAALSGTLTKQILDVEKAGRMRLREEMIAKAFEDGIPPEQQEKFDDAVDDITELDKRGRAAAADAANKGIDAPTVRQVRKLSGWAAVYYAEGQAKAGAFEYPEFFQQAKQNITVQDAEGKDVTYDTTNDPAIKDQIVRQIRQQFFARYKDLKPELLNKHMFEPIRRYELNQSAQWFRDQKKRLEQEIKDEGVEAVSSAFTKGGGPGANIYAYLNQAKDDHGGHTKTRKFVIEQLKTLLDGKAIDTSDISEMLKFEFKNHAGEWTTIRKQFPDLAAVESYAVKQGLQHSKEYEQLKEAQKNNFINEIYEIDEEYRQKGENIPQAELEALIKRGEQFFGGTLPDRVNDIITREEEVDETKEELIESKLARGLPITMEDLKGASNKLRMKYLPKVGETSDMAQYGPDLMKKVTARVNTIVRETFGLSGERGVKDKELATIAEQRGIEAGRIALANAMKVHGPGLAAVDMAIDQIRASLQLPEGRTRFESIPILNQSVSAGKRQLTESLNIVEDYQENSEIVEEGIIEGTYDTLKKFAEHVDKGGKIVIPETYRVLAANSNGRYDKYQIADKQLKAFGHKGILNKPTAEMRIDEMSAGTRRLLRLHPTNSRAFRGMYGGNSYDVAGPATGNGPVSDNWSEFLDLVASVESKAHGGYDAMNVPYTNLPYNSNQYLQRPLSEMTIGEVMNLQDQGVVHAAGRYQFTNHEGTLGETLAEAGLNAQDVFSPENQDKLAIARARWRVRTFRDQGISALRDEWVGLDNVNDLVLQGHYKNIVNDRSPYNRPENLSPALAKKVYTTGNIGPTSTGPHLDVKRTDRSFFNYGDLDNFVEVQDKDLGRVPLSKVPQTGDFASHTRRGSHGRDYGTYSGSDIFLKNGAKVVSTTPTEHGDKLVIRLPDGREFSFLHGKAK